VASLESVEYGFDTIFLAASVCGSRISSQPEEQKPSFIQFRRTESMGTGMKELKIGQRHLAVCKLQAALNKDAKLRGLNRASGFPIKTDGHFGEKTKLALMQFQAARNLPQTGIADEATLKLLRLHEVRHTPAAKHVPSLCELKNPLQERLSQFLSSAENDYGVDVRITCTLRAYDKIQFLYKSETQRREVQCSAAARDRLVLFKTI
jgi:peptidoglycan hydrolase-like protein with peptidoglycan-binding domain